MNAIPTTRHRFATIRHRPAARTRLPAEQKPHSVPGHRCEGRTGVLFEGKAKVCSVESDGGGNVIDHVADANCRHGLVLLLSRLKRSPQRYLRSYKQSILANRLTDQI